MTVLFSDLCEKDVINCSDGAILGNVSDLEICISECKVTAIIIDNHKGLFCKKEKIRIPWEKIEKIGVDVIIVNYCSLPIPDKCEIKQKRFFSK